MSVPGFLSNQDLTRLEEQYPELRSGRCPTCADKKVYRWQGAEHGCVCDEQKRLYVRYLNAGIGDTYQRLSWTDLAMDPQQYAPVHAYLDDAEDYVRAGMGLLLHGPVGTGKTLLGNLVLKELVKRDYTCFGTTFASTVEAFTAGWGNNKAEKDWFARKFMHSQVLLLDDLGKEFRSAAGLSPTTFDHIIRTRVQSARPTILTTNMSAQELQNGYGSAVLSMLVEQSVEVELTGEDFRPQRKDIKTAEVKAKETRPIT